MPDENALHAGRDQAGDNTSRRAVIGGVGGGLAASAAAAAQNQGSEARPQNGQRPRTALQDPRTEYPKPPFPDQNQPWPALASRMNPRPDHGETSYVGSGRLAGRKALVTGGDSGIGRAAVIAFAREGADVVINHLPAEQEDADEVVALIRKEGRKGISIPGDIRDEAFCQQLVENARRELGGLDILVNNAARQRAHKSIEEISTADFDQTMKTNLYGMFWITKAALPQLQPGSVIINTASVVAYDPPLPLLDYAMTKAAIVSFTRSLAKQLAEKGIRVNAVAPGPYWTPLQVGGGQLPGSLPKFGAKSSLGRPGQPAEIAPLYVLIASGEASYTSANVWGSTGGEAGP